MARSRKVDESFIPVRVISGSIDSTNLDTDTIAKVEFPGFEPEEVTYWQNRGFYQAIALPYEHREIEGINVLVVKPLLRSNSAAQKYGFRELDRKNHPMIRHYSKRYQRTTSQDQASLLVLDLISVEPELQTYPFLWA